MGREGLAAPPALLQAHGGGPEDAPHAAERLGGVRRGDAPDHGGRKCLSGRARSASVSGASGSTPRARPRSSRRSPSTSRTATQDLVARGAVPEDARRSALEELAGPALAAALKDTLPRPAPSRTPPPETDGGLFHGLGKDIRYGARRLRLEPAFALVAILSLALGIGANTAIFQLVDAVRLRSLPDRATRGALERPHRAVEEGRTGSFSGHYPQLTSLLFERIRAEQKAFSKLAVWSCDRVNLASGGEARYAEALWVSGTFFDTVGVVPLRGRLLGPADDMPGCPSPSVVVSEPFWRRELGGRALSPGETIALEGHRFEIAGITPARFFGIEVGHAFDVALPTCAEDLLADEPRTQSRSAWWLSAVGRLAPGWTLEKANAHLDAISKGIFEASLPEDYDADGHEELSRA